MVEVANYRSVFNPARLNTAITAAFVTLFLPVIARLFARDDIEGLRRATGTRQSSSPCFTFPIFALTGPLAPATTVILFGNRYAESALVLAILSIGYYFNVMLGFNAYTLQVCGRIRYLVRVNIFMFSFNIGLALPARPAVRRGGCRRRQLRGACLPEPSQPVGAAGKHPYRFIDRGCLRQLQHHRVCAAALWGFQLLVTPGLILCALSAMLVSALVLYVSRDAWSSRTRSPNSRRFRWSGSC